MPGLWDDFINDSSVQEVIDKVNNPKKAQKSTKNTLKKLSLEERLTLIREKVLSVLGRYKNDIVVIKTKEELHNYMMAALVNNLIGVDTETNRSLDPFTGKFVGFCFYTYGQKRAYVPINHTDLQGNRLEWQLTEKDVYDELEIIIKNNVRTVLSNGKFDYKFIKKVGERLFNKPLELQVWWDTQIAARLLDENEKRIGLKPQYKKHIDPTQDDYSIEELFEGVDYEVVEPEIFALYSAHDPYMSVKVYEWQENQFKIEHLDKVYKLFREVEMPVLQVTAEMELDGIELDLEYAKRLSKKYTAIAEEQDKEVYNELSKYNDQITRWRLSEDAQYKPTKEVSKETYLKNVKNKQEYVEKNGKYYKYGKSKNEQLEEPINLESPTQLAILIYDIFKCPQINKKTPRSVDKKTLPLLEKYVPFIKVFLEGKKMKTLLNSFIDKLPTMLGPDGRIHGEFNQLGNEEEGNEETVVTGRMCSSNPNMQQIPSKAKDIRMMFKASTQYKDVECENNLYIFNDVDEVEVDKDMWKRVKDLQIGDRLLSNDNTYDTIQHIEIKDTKRYVYING